MVVVVAAVPLAAVTAVLVVQEVKVMEVVLAALVGQTVAVAVAVREVVVVLLALIVVLVVMEALERVHLMVALTLAVAVAVVILEVPPLGQVVLVAAAMVPKTVQQDLEGEIPEAGVVLQIQEALVEVVVLDL
jgi:hypothetical protein